MRGLAGKQAVVTSAASGIGHAIVRRLVEEGASVMAVDIRPFDDTDDGGGLIRFAQADVSDDDSVARPVRGRAGRMGRHGRPDANSAGIIRAGVPLVASSIGGFDRIHGRQRPRAVPVHEARDPAHAAARWRVGDQLGVHHCARGPARRGELHHLEEARC